MENWKEVGTRLREFREALTMAGEVPARQGVHNSDKRADFAESIGVSSGSIGNWEAGITGIQNKNMMAMAEVYGLNTDWLRSGRGEMRMGSGTRRWRGETPSADEIPTLPVYTTECIEGGAVVVRKQLLERIDLPEPLKGRAGAYGLFISGSAMAPAFRYGDTAFVDPLLPPIELTEVVLVRGEPHEGGELVKLICTLLSYTDREWTISTSPSEPTRVAKLLRAEWPKCHRIIGKFARR